MSAPVPAPPTCPEWCEAEHPATGWDEADDAPSDEAADTAAATTLTKICERSIDFLKLEDGYVEIVVDRMVGADLTPTGWQEHSCPPAARVLTERTRTLFSSASEIGELVEMLRAAADLIRGGAS